MQFYQRILVAVFTLSSFLSFSTALAGPLHDAALSGDVKEVQILLDSGADPNAALSDGGPTPLFFAAERGHPDVVALLVSQGADVNNPTHRGGALHIAAKRGNLEIVKLLLDAGADPNLLAGDPLVRPLHEAAYKGSVEVVDMLLDYGADVNGRTEFRGQEPAIHFAAGRGHTDVVALLRERGFKPWTPDPIVASELVDADLEVGRLAALEHCSICHSFEPDGHGRRAASLWNMVGATKASDPTMAYSEALASLTGVWDFESLNVYLSDVQGQVPGSAKYYGTVRDREARIALIAYLRTLADAPVPLPN